MGSPFLEQVLLAAARGNFEAEGFAAIYPSPSQQNVIPRLEVTSTSPAGLLGVWHGLRNALDLPQDAASSWLRYRPPAQDGDDDGTDEDSWEAETVAEEAADIAAAEAEAAGAAGAAAGGYEPAGNRQRAPTHKAADEPRLVQHLTSRVRLAGQELGESNAIGRSFYL